MAEIEFKGHTFDTGLIIVFIGAFILLIWIILKLFRIVETPLAFELMSWIAGLVTIFGFGISVGKILQIIKHLQYNAKETNKCLDDLSRDHILLKSEFNHFVRYKKSLSS